MTTSPPLTVRSEPTSIARMCSTPCAARSASRTAPAAEAAYTTPMTASCDTRRSRLRVSARTSAPDDRREEARAVRLPGVKLVAEQERRGGAEGGDLGQRDVDEDDLARQHVDTQIGVDAREDQAHEERRPQERQEIGEHAAAVDF